MVKESALRFAKDKIFKVISSLSGGFVKVVMLNDSSTTYSISNNAVRPIPLTPEILEKNGWVKEVMSRGVKNSHWVYTKPDIEEYGYFPIYIEKGIGKEFDVYPFTDNRVCKQIVYIKYVHELQHLLFGLGLNSEMEVWLSVLLINIKSVKNQIRDIVIVLFHVMCIIIKGWNTDKNGFLCAIAFNITHWKPIEKLEE